MVIISRKPVYNLSAVLKETGLQADVLRAWERRYNLPKPERTAGGHRLYSDYDIATIKWLRARQQEGFSISRAVALWNERVEAGEDPVGGYADTINRTSEPGKASPDQIDLLGREWLKACMAFDTSGAEEILNQAFARFPVETVCYEIISRGISQIGSMWQHGSASVQQEHFTTTLGIRRIQTLITAAPNPTRSKTILVGCPELETHSFPLILMTLILRRRGWNVTYLGANVPLEQLDATVQAISPVVTVLAAQLLVTAETLQRAAVLFQKNGFPLGYGGLIFNRIPELQARIPAHFLGEVLKQAIDRVEELALAPNIPAVQVREASVDVEALNIYQARLPAIEAALLERFPNTGTPAASLQEINVYFSENLAAAIKLGDPRYVEPDLQWVEKLILDRNLSPVNLYEYLTAYSAAVRSVLGSGGAAVTGWIDGFLAEKQSSISS